MAAFSPFFATSPSLLCCRPPSHRPYSLWLPPLVTSCATSIPRSRARRKLMTDADLRKGILEFVSSFGFPLGHVPSTKELADHGRKDLSNIVRRRGYKLIKEILSNSHEVTKGSRVEDSLVEEQNVVHTLEHDTTGQNKQDKDVTEETLDSTIGVSSSEDRLQTTTESYVYLDDKNTMPIVPPNGSSLQEKLENFLKHDLNANIWLNDCHPYGGDKKNSPVANSSIRNQENSTIANGRNGSFLNGTPMMPKQIANTAAGGNIMRSNGSLFHEGPSDYGSNGTLFHKEPSDDGVDQDLNIETIETEDEAAVELLKYKLKLKELELSQLQELIEKEEEALSILESQEEDVIKKTEKLLSEMDAELIDAEGSLAELKEVQIQYLGEGQLVEVAGSFNGWHQRISMDPQPPCTGETPSVSRNLRLWSTFLWLYPGEYEIKFVVDGKWTIDPEREVTTRAGMQNNVLRVDR